MRRWVALQLTALLSLSATGANLERSAAYHETSLHTVFGAECNNFFDWQSLGVVYSHSKAHVPGPITRLLSCRNNDLQAYRSVYVPGETVVCAFAVNVKST